MEKDIKGNLRFSNYIVDYVEFYYNPESNSGEEFEIDFNIKDHYKISDDQKRMVVDLEVEIFRDAREKGYPFNLNMRVVGFFEMSGGDGKIDIFKKNAIAILYPYIRSLVTSYTASANVVPLILPAININKFISEKEENCMKK